MSSTNKPFIYFGSLFIIYLFYALVFVGVLSTVPKYVYIWNTIVQIGICVFLMVRYHPFRKTYKLDIYDAKMIFGASTLLLLNFISIPLAIKNIFTDVSNTTQTKIQSVGTNIMDINGDESDDDANTMLNELRI